MQLQKLKKITLLPPFGIFLSAAVLPLHVLLLCPNSLHLLHLTVPFTFFNLLEFVGSSFVFLLAFLGLPIVLLKYGGWISNASKVGHNLGPLLGSMMLL